MTTKFKKSNIVIQGEMTIWFNDDKIPRLNFALCGLNQSKSGVYCLRNKLNGRFYIGMASNLERRKWRHFNDLVNDKHPSKTMQEDFNSIKYGENLLPHQTSPSDVFEFEVIIYCYPSQLTFWEGLLIDNLKPYYNSKKKKEMTYDIPEESDKRLLSNYDLEDKV